MIDNELWARRARKSGETLSAGWGALPEENQWQLKDGLTLAALIVTIVSVFLGPARLFPVLNFPATAIDSVLPDELALLVSVLCLLAGFVVTYWALFLGRADGLTGVRSVAWMAVAILYVCAFFWFWLTANALSTSYLKPGVLVFAAIIVVHLFMLAMESSAGRYIVAGIIASGLLFALVAPSIVAVREDARRSQITDRMANIAREFIVGEQYRVAPDESFARDATKKKMIRQTSP